MSKVRPGKNGKPKKQRYDTVTRLYDSFQDKDMSLDEFRRAYERETSPRKAQKDLAAIIQFRQTRQTQQLVAAHQKQKIDAKLSEG